MKIKEYLYLTPLLLLSCGESNPTVFGASFASQGQETSFTDTDTNSDTQSENESEEDSSGDSGEDSSEEGAESDTGNPIKWDLASIPDFETSKYCTAVNVVLVIDDSGSMEDYQDALAAAFPSFVEEITLFLEGLEQAHVLVTRTGRLQHICQQNCNGNINSCLGINPPNWNLCVPLTFDDCHQKLGSGVIRPVGTNSSNADCFPDSGDRFLDWFSLSQEKREQALACVMGLGSEGSNDEWPLGAALGSLYQSDVGFCNEGFALQNSAWIFIILTDEDDHTDNFEGDLEKISTLVEDLKDFTKDPTLESVAVIGFYDLFPTQNDNCLPPGWFDKPKRLISWMQEIPNKKCWNIKGNNPNDPDFNLSDFYSEKLHESLDTIKGACNAAG